MRRIPLLDGWRAVAIAMVLVHHIVQGFYATQDSYAADVTRYGAFGVDIFFGLSGLLITRLLLEEWNATGSFRLRQFYVRRAFRILPPVLVFLAVYTAAGMWKSTTEAVSSLLFFRNYVPSRLTGFGTGHLWSLAIEEHFYLLWPLLVRLLNRTTLFVLTLIIVFGTPILRGICAYRGMDPELEIYIYSFFRFDGLALGAILALWVRSPYYSRVSAWKLAGVLVGLSLAVTVIGWPYGIMGTRTVASSALRYTQAQLMFAGAIALALAYRGSGITGILRSRPARFVADVSYCIYLIHLAMGDAYYFVLQSIDVNDVGAFGAVGALAVRSVVIGTLTFGVAVISKRFLEDPFLRLKRYFHNPRKRAVMDPSGLMHEPTLSEADLARHVLDRKVG